MQILFVEDEPFRVRLYPLTYTRPIADLRIGILTITEKWQKHLEATEVSYQTANYLQEKYPKLPEASDCYWIKNGLLPDEKLTKAILSLSRGEAIYHEDQLLAGYGSRSNYGQILESDIVYEEAYDQISRTWDLFRKNGQEIKKDFQLITEGRQSSPLEDQHTITYGSQIFLEPGATVKAAVLNAENGPIYLGKNSEVQEGALIRGPFGLGESSVVNMGAKIRGDTSTGPHCKIGGEISNVLFHGFSNKGHDGFLGNSVIGEWCNIGADTNNSNLKNNYDEVRMWDYESGRFIHTGLQFCGLIMADHSKCGINTMFNTGTTVGVAANIFGEGFPRNVIPSFAWGGASGMVTHQPRKAFITASVVMKRRNLDLTETDKAILNHIFEVTAPYRVWEEQKDSL